jgi:hypothetical protein
MACLARVLGHADRHEPLGLYTTGLLLLGAVFARYFMGQRSSLAGQALPPAVGLVSQAATNFSDTIAAVRQPLWSGSLLAGSPPKQDPIEIPHVLLQHLTEALGIAA